MSPPTPPQRPAGAADAASSTARSAGWDALDRRDWTSAFEAMSAADEESGLPAEDLERLATVAYLLGRDAQSSELLARAFHAHCDAGRVEPAVRCAFWLSFGLITRGDMAQGQGWLGRGQRLLDEADRDCVERGYLQVPSALGALMSGDGEAALALFTGIARTGDRFADVDLSTLARLGQGQALVQLGRPAEGLALLDEIMVAVAGGEVSPVVSGLVYCAVIVACQDVFDVRRAREWTSALSRWCDTQPDLVPYRGQCLVHRAELMALGGDWADAMREAGRARASLSKPTIQPAVGMALYQQAELHRLAGAQARAERLYRQANRAGRSPQPGLALLRLAQGHPAEAAAALRSEMAETEETGTRLRLLPACVEVLVGAGDVDGARGAADELAGLAGVVDSAYLRAVSARALGEVLLAEGDHRGAMSALRRAWVAWQEVEAPYDGARTRELMALAYRGLGDDDSAEMELDAALWVFRDLGATTDLARAESLSRHVVRAGPHGLTPREREVLALVATGRTNRAVATELVLSEKTVARHVSNIFTKIGCTSRAAATAYAYEHGLAGS